MYVLVLVVTGPIWHRSHQKDLVDIHITAVQNTGITIADLITMMTTTVTPTDMQLVYIVFEIYVLYVTPLTTLLFTTTSPTTHNITRELCCFLLEYSTEKLF